MRKVLLYKSKEKCCGCGACMNICPKRAISMREDENGYLYPIIDEPLCIRCQKCKKVCGYQHEKYKLSLKETYVAFSINTDILESASGGLFSGFAKNILDKGGLVYGCAMVYEDDRLSPKHICISSLTELSGLKGSKYVQSDLDFIYCDVKDKLENNKLVLFSGTPCQVAGLYGFLNKEYDNLYTLDIICHGVPNVKMFQDYISYMEKKIKGKIIDFRFRDKNLGWKLYGKMTVEEIDGTRKSIYFEPEQSSYYQMFLNSYTYRENCYSCPYASDNRQGDITIGDYWGIDLVHPELVAGPIDLKSGVSCMIVNNKQGKRLLQDFGSGILYYRSTYEKAAKYNAQLKKASVLKDERKKVLELYSRGYDKLEKWYIHRMIPVKIKRKVIGMIPRPVKRVVKTILRKN